MYFLYFLFTEKANKEGERAFRRHEELDEEHHHNATFEHSLTEKLLDAVLSDKIGHSDGHGHEVNLGKLFVYYTGGKLEIRSINASLMNSKN